MQRRRATDKYHSFNRLSYTSCSKTESSFIFLNILAWNKHNTLQVKVNELWYISLFVFSGSIKKSFSIDCVSIYLLSTFLSIDIFRWTFLNHFSVFFSIGFARWKKLFSIDCVNIYLLKYFFQLIFAGGKVCGCPTLLVSRFINFKVLLISPLN